MYRLPTDLPIGTGLQWVVTDRAASALRHLTDDFEHAPAEAVHDTRKDIKKLRSALRLTRGAIPGKVRRAHNSALRDVARSLGAARDAEVRVETLAGLRDHLGAAVPAVPELDGRLRHERELAATPGPDIVARAIAALEREAAALAELPLDPDGGFAIVEPGLRRAYGRGRAAMAAVRRGAEPDAVHAWRRRVKDHWYHLRLLRDGWPGGLAGPADAAHELADLLGDHHDLTVLVEVLDRDRPAEALVAEEAGRRQAELLAAALPLGARLYAEHPRALATRLGAYWT